LPEAKADAPALTVELVNDLCRAAPRMAWRQTYTATEVGREFLTHYPRHRHEAEEVYIPLAGTALWQQGDGHWRERQPGTVIHHSSDEPHAMRTGARVLLALYLWRSANLHQKSHFDP
jgi:hypothetical protein